MIIFYPKRGGKSSEIAVGPSMKKNAKRVEKSS